jgi:CPA2 family monovalent cation:H+ antiporter-2
MEASDQVTNVLPFLVAVVLTVPLCRALRVSPVLGYLAAGLALGSNGLGWIEWTDPLRELSEIGVLFLLFSIGLELSFERLAQLRRHVLGLGGAQVLVTGVLLAALTRGAFGGTPALVVGFSLAMSSTAIVLQLLRERGELQRRHGRASLAVLLLQDFAVIPLLVVIPVLAGAGDGLGRALVAAGAKALAVIAILFVLGRLLLRPVYHRIASLRSAEALLSLTLLVALGTGWATERLGLSMTLGAFLAGVLVAETEYRHQVEADVEPFRSLLLGLFFLGVGLSLDLSFVLSRLGEVAALATAVVAIKAAILFVLARVFGLPLRDAAPVALGLAQAGEFGFVALGLALDRGLLEHETGSVLLAVVAATMFASPLLLALGRSVGEALHRRRASMAPEDLAEQTADLEGHVVIAGCGRVGETVARVLSQRGVTGVGLEIDPARVQELRTRGLAVYVGDASRPQVLAAAGVERTAAAVVTLDEPAAAERICAALRAGHPHLPVLARARTIEHGRRLLDAGATAAVAEALEGSLELAGRTLEALEFPPDEVERTLDALRENDYAQLEAWRIVR